MFASLRVRNFRSFFVGQAISQTGTWMHTVAQVLLVLHITGSGVIVGLVSAAQFGPVLLLGTWTGLLADRVDKKRLLIAVQSAGMIQAVLMAVVAASASQPIWAIMVLALYKGILNALDQPVRRSIIVEMVPVKLVQNAVSLNSALMTGTRVLGPAIAGIVIGTLGYGACFGLDALSYVAVLIGLVRLDRSQIRSPELVPKQKGQIREGLRVAWREPAIRVPLMVIAVVSTFAMNFNVNVPLFVQRSLDGGEGAFSAIYSVLSAGSLAGALLTARRLRVGLSVTMLWCGAFGVTWCIFALVPTMWMAFPVAFFAGMTSMSFLAGSSAAVQLAADAESRGRIMALQAMVMFGTAPIGGPILGWIADTVGARATIGVGGVAAVAAALTALSVIRRLPRTVKPLEQAS